MNRLINIWLAITGRISQEQIIDLQARLDKAWMVGQAAIAEKNQLKRDIDFAKAAIADLKSKLPANWEAQQKAASDALGAATIADMNANPKKYLS